MGLLDYYRDRFFSDKQQIADADMFHKSRQAIDWMSSPYHKEFLDWLDAQSARPLNVKEGQMDLVQSAVRANTFREILDYLRRLERDAQDAVRQAEEE